MQQAMMAPRGYAEGSAQAQSQEFRRKNAPTPLLSHLGICELSLSATKHAHILNTSTTHAHAHTHTHTKKQTKTHTHTPTHTRDHSMVSPAPCQQPWQDPDFHSTPKDTADITLCRKSCLRTSKDQFRAGYKRELGVADRSVSHEVLFYGLGHFW